MFGQRVTRGLVARLSTGRSGNFMRCMSNASLPEAQMFGEEGTPDFKVQYFSGSTEVSSWHDIPLESACGHLNMITEIPKMTKAKMEIDTKARLNPIVQDTKKGKLRYYHGPIFWNYGCAPRTWEDPNKAGPTECGGVLGDNDPLDLVEIGSSSLSMGSITPVKVLGVLAMLDDGELDWKLIVLNTADPLANEVNDVADIEEHFPGTISGIREWFRWYKTPDGKPINAFGFDEACLDAAFAKHVVEETHDHYLDLIAGRAEPGKLWLPGQ
jgi:inorganic pyrophosphatase